jgi:hypothetical protein
MGIFVCFNSLVGIIIALNAACSWRVSKLIACCVTIIWRTMLGMDVWVGVRVRTGWVRVGFVSHVRVCGACGAMNGVDLLNGTRMGLETFLSSRTVGAGICGMGLITSVTGQCRVCCCVLPGGRVVLSIAKSGLLLGCV